MFCKVISQSQLTCLLRLLLSANQKLKQMLADQQEAEKRKITSQELHKDLQEQQKKISQKQKEVMEDLAKVEPAVMEAQQGEFCWRNGGPIKVVKLVMVITHLYLEVSVTTDF